MPVTALLTALLSGVLLATLGIPGDLSALTPLPLAGLFWLIAAARSPRGAALRAFMGGLGFFAVHLLWLPSSFGAGFGPFGAIMFIPLYALEAGFWALLAAITFALGGSFAARAWLLAFGWVILEWLRHLGPLAFPWGTVGYTLLPTPAAQVAEFGGVLLLSLLVTTAAAALATATRGHLRPLVPVLLAWAAAFAYGNVILARPETPGPTGRALLLRTDFNSFEKAAGNLDALSVQLDLSRAVRPDEVLVWSETAVWATPFLDQRARLPDRPLITGIRFPQRNAVVAWNGEELATYDKSRLVPFGEYFPLSGPLKPLYDRVFMWLGFAFERTEPGVHATPLPLAGQQFGTYVCYDSVFGSVTRALTLRGADVLVNVSNDGWYGRSVGVEQHFQMGRLRAIETRRYVLRSVNDGVAAVIDHRGRVLSRLDEGRGVLHAAYVRRDGLTLYVRFGDVPVVLACLLGILLVVRAERIARRRAL